jgi:hypothetical protein
MNEGGAIKNTDFAESADTLSIKNFFHFGESDPF